MDGEANITELLILALGSRKGLRRSEIASIGLDEIQGDNVLIKGKGRGLHPRTHEGDPQSVPRVQEDPHREERQAGRQTVTA